MSRLEQLYQDMILEHNKNPRQFKELPAPTHRSHGVNPLCGDDYWVFLDVKEGTIVDIGFTGNGCAISKSSGSLMSSTVMGKTVEEALTLKDAFLAMVTDNANVSPSTLGRLAVFEGVKKFPARVKCAALVWRALEDALNAHTTGRASTE
jgi:nitrogen fixation NifU-like protein